MTLALLLAQALDHERGDHRRECRHIVAQGRDVDEAFGGEVADYVLSSFDAIERAALPDCLRQSVQSVLEVAARGFEAAMNVRNTRPKPGRKPPEAS